MSLYDSTGDIIENEIIKVSNILILTSNVVNTVGRMTKFVQL